MKIKDKLKIIRLATCPGFSTTLPYFEKICLVSNQVDSFLSSEKQPHVAA